MDGGRREGEKKERITEGGRVIAMYLPAFSFLMKLTAQNAFCLLLNAYSAAFSCTGDFSSSCAHPPANSHEINSTHPSFYLHHLAEAKKNHFAKVPSTGQDISPHCHCTHPSHIQLFKWFGVLWNQRFIPASLTFY